MGLLFTTPGTQRIIDTLNTAFDGPGKGLELIQGAAASKDSKLGAMVATRNWMPGYLALMLDLLPYDQSPTNPTRGPTFNADQRRWKYFLRKVLGPTAAFAPIRSALADAILKRDSSGAPLNIVRVSFDCVELTGSANPNVVIFDAPLPGDGGATVRHITLFTKYVEGGPGGPTPPLPVDPHEPADREPANPPWKKPVIP
jgi:hypothetical protein